MIAPGLTVACKEDLFNGVHQPGDTFKLALYSDSANLGPFTTEYVAAGEVSGQGYTSGGVVLTGKQVNTVGAKTFVGWGDALIRNATISARGGLVYNASKQNRVFGVVDLGKLVTSTNGNFKVDMRDVFWVA